MTVEYESADHCRISEEAARQLIRALSRVSLLRVLESVRGEDAHTILDAWRQNTRKA